MLKCAYYFTVWVLQKPDSGTGSYPPGCQGPHLDNLTADKIVPLNAPWTETASRA